ncbi:putative serine esterase-domain-containing protein [Cokeromyces recurvatus]|uniref:putative serine esterase-domain-containing protein n=1 Tax=Cokeromyces recurvatus TaxID=90255 RepID=UPI0022202A03|nr:putative serine esterase-domain-containing protein [Cokeromyces recurvatus]KAI7898540.1 putative serine esterase-domain-containing protein [Cokeromyces recurvatus]
MDKDTVSLVVLSHGLWGVKSHMSYIEKKLKEKYRDSSICILNSSINEAKYTYDGIDICGIRLANEIESTVARFSKDGKQVKKISFIGYSLGGLITRFAIGVLGQRGVFKRIEPLYFITFATPHLGVRLPSSSVVSSFFNLVSGKLVSRSGEQLQLIDNYQHHEPLLEVMSDPDGVYFKYLSMFKVRRIYANIANDRTVPYWTAGIELMDYFYNSKGKLDLTLDEAYISVITAFDIRHSTKKSNGQMKAFKEKERKPLKTVALKYTFYCLFPIAAPLFVLIALSVLSYQGIISRYRASQLLHKQQRLLKVEDKNESGRRKSTATDQIVHGEFLAGTLDAVNLMPPGEENDNTVSSLDDHPQHNHYNNGNVFGFI